ncbi:MAG: hypothetical protein PHH01_03140 [Patescibacteria group bacterium]|nr:hypothetical protein [Patescibacteria group bacterium]
MRRNDVFTAMAFVSLVVLLVIELATKYDTWPRQVALSITNLVGGGIYLVIFFSLRRRGIALPWIIAWLVAAGIWIDGLANFQHLFGRILWWDKLAHFVGSMAPTAMFWAVLSEFHKKSLLRLPSWLTNIVSISLTMLIVVIYEISEYIGDQFFPTHRITDLYDTADDLMYNLLGAIIVVIFCILIARIKKNKENPRGVDL